MVVSNTQKCIDDNNKNGHTYVQWLVAGLASATVLNYGLETGWMSPMTKVLQSDESPIGIALSANEISWIGSTLSLAAVIGVSLYAYIVDRFGRKVGVIAIAVPQAICWALKLTATSSTMLIIARVIGGLPAGGCFNVIPMYAKEISQDNIRGAVVSMTMVLQNIGMLIMYAMGSYMDYYTVAWIAMVVPLLAIISMLFAPEAPGFLVKKGKLEEAAKTVALLRGLDVEDKIVKNEVDYMIKQEEHFRNTRHISFFSIFKNRVWRRGFIMVLLIITAQAFNGHFTIMTYAWSILSALGVTINPDLLSLVVPSLMIVGSMMSVICVERLGRKIILATTYSLITVAMATMAMTLLMQKYEVTTPSWLPVLAVAISAWSYAAGVIPMIYVVMSEIFSFQVRAKLIGCIVTYAWFTSSMQLALFKPVTEALGTYTMFFVFSAVNLFGAVATLVLLPETKGKTLEEIEDILGK